MSCQKPLYLFLLMLPVMVMNAQRQFELTVKLPKGVDPDIIETRLDNGSIQNLLITPVRSSNGQLVYKGTYNALYASISMQYKSGRVIKQGAPTNCLLFIQETPAVVTLTRKDTLSSIFENYSLQHATDFKEERNKMERYDAIERGKALDYELKYGEQLFTGKDTAIRNYYFKVLRINQKRKQLEYIKKHPESYYSFYCFRTEMMQKGIASPDSLLSFFNTVFPAPFRYSEEGNNLKELLYNRLPAKARNHPIDFVARDIRNHVVQLSSFKGRRFVLLHFWGTWCHGCVLELPAIKEIQDKYEKKGLQIISIGYRSAKAGQYEEAVKKYVLNWIHIYDDEDLINKYGNRATPSLCLIDKTGKILYDSEDAADDSNDIQLKRLKDILERALY